MSFVVHRVSKQVARYTDAGGREKCGYCRFFVPPRSCGKVIGPVSPAGWCKHFSRQMVSQSGGGSTPVAGGPPGKTLDLNFMSSGTMPAGITFTRASTATYTDASGVIQTAAINAPRWDYASGSSRGLLIEEQRTNLALQSGNLANAAWSPGGTAGAPVVTANNTTAPDGTTTAARIVYPAVSAGQYSNVNQNISVAATPASFSIWLRGAVGGERVYLNTTYNGANFYSVPAVLTTAWQRFSLVTGSLAAAAGWYWQLGVDLRDGTQSATPAQTIYAWGAQIEQGPFATSYIPTILASVARAFDNCFIASASMAPWFASPGGSWFAEFVSGVPVGTQDPRIIGIHNATSLAPIYRPSDGTLHSYDGADIFAASTVVAGALSKAVSTWAPGTGKICLNGGAVGTGAMAAGFATLATAGVGLMGGNPGSSGETMTGYVRRVQYWPRVLSNAEMQQVTT